MVHCLIRVFWQSGETGPRNFRPQCLSRGLSASISSANMKSRARLTLGYNALARCGRRRRTANFSRPGRGTTVTNQAIVDTMVERIVTRFQPARILLFGSRARGTDNRWSDVDLLVVMDEVEDKRRAAVEMGRALGDLSVSKDIVVTTDAEIARRGNVIGTVLRAALREGKVVYERP